MVAGRDPEHAQPVQDKAEHDRLPGHAGPKGSTARRVDEEKRDHLRIDDVVVVMIPVRLHRRYCRTHSELVMAWWMSGLKLMIQASRMGCLSVNHPRKKPCLVRLSEPQ